jgi:hypothetical protein
MIVILLVFCCHVIQDTRFTVDNWCLCLHSTEVQNVYKTYDSNIRRTALQLWQNDCINWIKFCLLRESVFLNNNPDHVPHKDLYKIHKLCFSWCIQLNVSAVFVLKKAPFHALWCNLRANYVISVYSSATVPVHLSDTLFISSFSLMTFFYHSVCVNFPDNYYLLSNINTIIFLFTIVLCF